MERGLHSTHVLLFIHDDIGIAHVCLGRVIFLCSTIFGHMSWLATIIATAPEWTDCRCCSPSFCHIGLASSSPVWILTSLASSNVHWYWNIVHPPWCIGGVILRSIRIIGRLSRVLLEEWTLGSILAKGVLEIPLVGEPRVTLVALCTDGFNK